MASADTPSNDDPAALAAGSRDGERHPSARESDVRSAVREAVWLFATMRIGLTAFAAGAALLLSAPPPCFHHGVVDWPTMPVLYSEGLGAHLLGVWQRWDACWYLRIATFGYEADPVGTAFFPLYPVLIRALAVPLLGNTTLSALIVSGLAYVAAIAVLHRLIGRDFDRDTARRTCLYLSIFPTAFFLFAPFTEALFLALAVTCIYCMRTGSYVAAAVTGFLAALTRNHGLLLVLPLAWEAVLVARGALDAPRAAARWLRPAAAAAVTVAPLLGFAAYYAYTTVVLGTDVFGARDQHWGWVTAPPWSIIGGAIGWVGNPANAGFFPIHVLVALHIVLLIAFFAAFVAGLRILPVAYSLYFATHLAALSTGGPATPLASASRYMLVVFPAFVVLAVLIGRRRRAHLSWVLGSSLSLALLLVAFLQNVPVG